MVPAFELEEQQQEGGKDQDARPGRTAQIEHVSDYSVAFRTTRNFS